MTPSDKKIKIIGITGNSGSGKSLVAGICASFGAYVINADEINHENMMAGQPAYYEICAVFGTNVLDDYNEINRRKLGEKVFADKGLLQILESITHKYVKKEIMSRAADIATNPADYSFIVIDAPLLIEAGINKNCDETWLVTADYATRLGRVRKRDTLSDEEILRRFASATPESELEKHADITIDNNSDDIIKLRDCVRSLLIKRGMI